MIVWVNSSYEDDWKSEVEFGGFTRPSLHSQHSIKDISQPFVAYPAHWTPFLESHDQLMVQKHHSRLTQDLRYATQKPDSMKQQSIFVSLCVEAGFIQNRSHGWNLYFSNKAVIVLPYSCFFFSRYLIFTNFAKAYGFVKFNHTVLNYYNCRTWTC